MSSRWSWMTRSHLFNLITPHQTGRSDCVSIDEVFPQNIWICFFSSWSIYAKLNSFYSWFWEWKVLLWPVVNVETSFWSGEIWQTLACSGSFSSSHLLYFKKHLYLLNICAFWCVFQNVQPIWNAVILVIYSPVGFHVFSRNQSPYLQ